ncbi:MAG: hypothetical protein WD063_18480 [Pirellulales bacterium]
MHAFTRLDFRADGKPSPEGLFDWGHLSVMLLCRSGFAHAKFYRPGRWPANPVCGKSQSPQDVQVPLVAKPAGAAGAA